MLSQPSYTERTRHPKRRAIEPNAGRKSILGGQNEIVGLGVIAEVVVLTLCGFQSVCVNLPVSTGRHQHVPLVVGRVLDDAKPHKILVVLNKSQGVKVFARFAVGEGLGRDARKGKDQQRKRQAQKGAPRSAPTRRNRQTGTALSPKETRTTGSFDESFNAAP